MTKYLNYLLLPLLFMCLTSCTVTLKEDDSSNSSTVTPVTDSTVTTTFKTYNFNSSSESYNTESATLVYNGDHCYVYAQTGQTNSTQRSYLISLGEYFDDSVYSKISTELDMTPYDPDNNNKSIFYFTTSIPSGGSSGTVVGYFNSIDLYAVNNSNRADILYINLNVSGSSNDSLMKETLIHEYQHLLNESYRISTTEIGGTVGSFETWIEEGLADGVVNHIDTNISRAAYFSTDLPQTADGQGLIAWSQNYLDYTLSLTFFEYARIQCNMDISFYESVAKGHSQSNYQDLFTVVSANSSNFDSFSTLLSSYYIANLVNASSGLYGYKGEYTVGNISSLSSSSASLEPGAAIYYSYSDNTALDDFSPENNGSNISFYRINAASTSNTVVDLTISDYSETALVIVNHDTDPDSSDESTGTLPSSAMSNLNQKTVSAKTTQANYHKCFSPPRKHGKRL